MNEIEELDLEQELPEIKIVPTRWDHTGWKYVLEDPEKKKYFNNPNRINGAYGGNIDVQPQRGSFEVTGTMNSMDRSYARRASEMIGTTYG